MDFIIDELGVLDTWHAAQQHMHLLPALATCAALTGLFMYWLFTYAHPLSNIRIFTLRVSWETSWLDMHDVSHAELVPTHLGLPSCT